MNEKNYPDPKTLPMVDGIELVDNEIVRTPREVLYVEQEGRLLVVDGDALDYSGCFRGGESFIDPSLEEWASRHGGYWEWETPGSVVFCR